MCTVQVLLVADVMRRTTFNNSNSGSAIRPSARSICRRLFPEDNVPSERSSSVVLHALEADIQREVAERWNFDFRAEKPLPGRYQWVPVHPAADRTAADSAIADEVKTNNKQDSHKQTCRSKATTQSKITDFLHQRKRTSKGEPTLSCPKMKLRRLLNSSSSTSTATADVVSSSSARD